MQLPEYLEPLSRGLYAIDTGLQRPRANAAYLLIDSGRAAFIDTGTRYAVPRLLGALSALGLPIEAVDWVIPTHVHLDHAGGCGLLMQQLPAATLLVHPRGARHMIDPSALYAGTLAVYGQEETDRTYGELPGIEARRVRTTEDGTVICVGERALEFIHTPGHARHHHCIWDAQSRGWLTGDTFGLSYREFDVNGRAWNLPTSSPAQFEPEPLKTSIHRLLAREPQHMYITHYGAVGDVPRLAKNLLSLLDGMVDLALAAPVPAAPRHTWLKQALEALYLQSVRQHGCTVGDAAVRQLLAMDIELNAQGLAIWLDKQDPAAGAAP